MAVGTPLSLGFWWRQWIYIQLHALLPHRPPWVQPLHQWKTLRELCAVQRGSVSAAFFALQVAAVEIAAGSLKGSQRCGHVPRACTMAWSIPAVLGGGTRRRHIVEQKGCMHFACVLLHLLIVTKTTPHPPPPQTTSGMMQ
jgi:hypothetical protein